ncbi:MAG: glycoside hydrolase [Candidatus Sericytochromatia bacterium]
MALVWHMHQPMYKDRATGQYLMPWVRLHAQKDYLDMLAALEPYPTLAQTFNLVPSLVEQLLDYADHEAWDRPLALLVAPVASLTPEDKRYILDRFFDLNWQHMLYPHPRYAELADLRERAMAGGPEAALGHFSDADWQDLTVWFNLAWFDPHWLATDQTLAALVRKGRGYSQGDRETLLGAIRDCMRRVVPTYRRMAEAGRIELTTTPYYHPILPLLCDRDSARVARPHLPLPAQPFRRPEDAGAQVEKGLASFERHFGRRPVGMWPSEQAVSPEALGLLARAGVQWAISDEGVLGHTLGLRFGRDAAGRPLEAAALYQPYAVETPEGPVSMVFRDLVLSDLIGFTYAHMAPEAAARDLHTRLTRIRQVLPDGGEDYLVTIALDGENCWEHYAQDGAPFLHAFYRLFEADPALEMTTVGGYLAAHPPRRVLPTIFSGSWIGADFTTWIGDATKNRAWDALASAREALESARERLEGTPAWASAIEELYIAEGSDWFWWFGEGHDSGQDELFDAQFRLHLSQLYQHLGLEAPEALARPFSEPPSGSARPPAGAISPVIDGKLEAKAWEPAGLYDPTLGQGAMHAGARFIRAVRYGADAERLYLGVRFADQLVPGPEDVLSVYLYYPGQPRHNAPIVGATDHLEGETRHYHFGHALHVAIGDRPRARLDEAGEYATWVPLAEPDEWAIDEALTLAMPWAWLNMPPGQEVRLVLAGSREGRLVEVLPGTEGIGLMIPRLEAMAER